MKCENSTTKMSETDLKEYLRSNIHTKMWKDMSRETGYNESTLIHRARAIGLNKVKKRIDKDKAIEYLKYNIDDFRWSEMAKTLNVSASYLMQLAQENGIKKDPTKYVYSGQARKYDYEKIREHLTKHIDDMPWSGHMKLFGIKSESYMIELAQLMGFKKNPAIKHVTKSKLNMNSVKNFLEKNINLLSWQEIGDHFKVSNNHICKIAKNLGFKKDPQFKQYVKSRVLKDSKFNKQWVIEGGALNNKKKWHADKWRKTNGAIPKDCLLVYQNGLGTYEDLILLKKKKFKGFIRHRNVIVKERNWAEKQLIKEKKGIISTIDSTIHDEVSNGKVPVKLNFKTVVFVDRNKCYLDESGNWKKR